MLDSIKMSFRAVINVRNGDICTVFKVSTFISMYILEIFKFCMFLYKHRLWYVKEMFVV